MQGIQKRELPRLYVIIDEYDNFANQLITGHHDHLYRELTAAGSFLKTFFKTLKEGRKSGAIANIFITGVLPITIDDLASGFNIATMITLEPEFEQMMGFTQNEVNQLLDDVYQDYQIDPATRQEVQELIISQYNGYHFLRTDDEALYNSTLFMYFLDKFSRSQQIPDYLIDLNLRTDLSWVRRITGAVPERIEEFVAQLTTQNTIPYDKDMLISKFNMSQFFEKDFYPISFYYLGMLTKQDQFVMRLPNLNMRKIFVEYFNELHHIDVSTKYADMMRGFVQRPDLPLQEEDTKQIAGYVQGLRQEYPEARVSQYVIYCFGNQGFRVFAVGAEPSA